jgi:hypothetical protein
MKSMSEVCREIENAGDLDEVVTTWREVIANVSYYTLPELAAILERVTSLTDPALSWSDQEDTDLIS